MVHVNRSEENSENSSIMDDLLTRQRAFHYTYEGHSKVFNSFTRRRQGPNWFNGKRPPLAVLSDRAQSLFSYFKQIVCIVDEPKRLMPFVS
ncbi:glutamate synthase central domain-containing protein [Bacillus sp. SL00103]